MKVTTYSSQREKTFDVIGPFINLIKISYQYRDLIMALFRRDFFMNQRRSFLSYAWLFISPIFGVLSWIFLNASGLLAPGDVGVPYPIFVMVGTCIWGLFLGSYNASAETLRSGSSLIFQVNFPHEILLVIQLALTVANFILGFSLVLILSFLSGILPSWLIVLIPFTLMPILFLGSGVGLLICIFGAVLPDLRKIVDLGIGLGFFLTPILYSKQGQRPLIDKIIPWNPLTHLIGKAQDLIFNTDNVNWSTYWIVVSGCFLFFLIAFKMFRSFESRLIEKLV